MNYIKIFNLSLTLYTFIYVRVYLGTGYFLSLYNHAVTYLYKVIFTDVGKYVKDRDVLAFTARGTTATSF